MAVMQQNRRYKVLFGQDNNSLTWLIIINAVVFVSLYFIQVIYTISYDDNTVAMNFYHQQVFNWFTLPADFGKLATRPWTILTYMFTNESVWGFISSVLWLWAFGYIFQDLTGNTKLIPVYLYGGIAGALCFLLSANLLPQISNHIANVRPLMGAGAAVMAVVIATTALQPSYRIFPMINGGIPVWILTVIYCAIAITTVTATVDGAAGGLALTVAGFTGFFFVHQLRRGKDWTLWMTDFWQWLSDLFNPEKKYKQSEKRQQLFYKAEKKPFEKKPHVTQQKLDELLDKINQKGYHFLTDEEKDFLKKASQEDF